MSNFEQMTEQQILDALIGGAANLPEKTVGIARINLSVTLRALKDDQIEQLEKRYTKVTKSRGEETKTLDKPRYYRALIVAATVAIGGNPSMKWDHPALKAKFQAMDGESVVKAALISGEITMLVDATLDISGHYDRAEEVDELKNGYQDEE